VVSAIVAKIWRAKGRKFVLKIGRDQATVLDEDGREVFTVKSSLSYCGSGDSLRLTSIGDPERREHESISIVDLHALPTEDGVQIFAGFVLFCLVKARTRAKVPAWRYATVDLEMSESHKSITGIVRAAGNTKHLRYAMGNVRFPAHEATRECQD